MENNKYTAKSSRRLVLTVFVIFGSSWWTDEIPSKQPALNVTTVEVHEKAPLSTFPLEGRSSVAFDRLSVRFRRVR